MSRLPETVNQQFNQLFKAIHSASDDLKIATAEASLEGDFALVTASMESCRQLQALDIGLKAYIKQFEGKQLISQPVEKTYRKRAKRYTRKSGAKLRVKIADKVIEHSTISDTFVETLKTFGLERVAKLNKTLSAIPLIDRMPTQGYQTQKLCNGWYITTHFNKPAAIRLLEEIGKELRMPLKIELIER
jgi:hypothetical protein